MPDQDPPNHGDADNDPSLIMGTVGRDIDDVRDHVFTASQPVAALPKRVDYRDYAAYVRETWHQRGLECTGFALAAIANYIFRKQLDDPDLPSVSRRMLYELAQLNDGEDYQTGSTPRGALKGWSRFGVATDDLWPYDPADEDGHVHGGVTLTRVLDARNRPLVRYRTIADGSKDAIRGALAEGYAVFASSDTHGGWYRLFLRDIEPEIRREPHDKPAGDHAFVIAGYDERGFWVHNSWGPEWGTEGYALLPYEEWENTWSSAWVIDAVAETHDRPASQHAMPDGSTGAASKAVYRDMWPHLVVLRDDGRLSSSGLYEMDEGSVGTLLFMFQEHAIEHDWTHRRLAVFADGGYAATAATIEHLRPVRDQLLQHGIYPIFIVWETAWFADLEHELSLRVRRRLEQLEQEAMVDSAPDKDVIAKQVVAGSALPRAWSMIRDRSRRACLPDGGGGHRLAEAITFKRNQKPFDIHLISHGTGDYLLAEFCSVLSAPVATITTIASASPLSVLTDTYGPMLDDGRLQHLSVINLDENAENADSFGPMSGSLLDLVSTILGARGPVRDAAGGTANPVPIGQATDQPLLGLQRHVTGDPHVERFVRDDIMSVEGVSGSTHVEMASVFGLLERITERMFQHQTLHITTRKDDDLPRDPLEWAEAMRQRASTS